MLGMIGKLCVTRMIVFLARQERMVVVVLLHIAMNVLLAHTLVKAGHHARIVGKDHILVMVWHPAIPVHSIQIPQIQLPLSHRLILP